MDDSFEIDIVHNGKELVFEAILISAGYIHRIQVQINGKEVIFEPDEERKYRAIVTEEFVSKLTNDDKSMIQAINDSLDSLKF